MTTSSTSLDTSSSRRIAHHARGVAEASPGPITRLRSPSALGQTLKPFVFLDILDVSGDAIHAMSTCARNSSNPLGSA